MCRRWRLDDLTAFGEMIRAALLNGFDRQRQDFFQAERSRYRATQPMHPARLQEPAHVSCPSARAHERSDRHPQTASALRACRVSCRAVQVDRAPLVHRGYLAKTASGSGLQTGVRRGPAMADRPDEAESRGTPVHIRRVAQLWPGLAIHPAAERFATGNELKSRKQVQRRGHGGAHRCLRQLWRIRSLGATFHIRELAAQSGTPRGGNPAPPRP